MRSKRRGDSGSPCSVPRHPQEDGHWGGGAVGGEEGGGGVSVQVLNNAYKIRGHAHGSENGTELFMVNRGVCALEIYVRGEAVATRGNGVFEG